MKAFGRYLVCILLLLALYTCKKAYAPTIVSTDLSYLVVEGVINSGADSTFITLTRTAKLNSNTITQETGATVTVESDKSDVYPLVEVKAGIYSIANLNLPTDRKFRLHIITLKGQEYLSDYVENKITPDIDSISYKLDPLGVQFYVSSHDPGNSTRYYKWDYDETWTYFSHYTSQLIYKNGMLQFRDPDSLVNTCYRHATPSNDFYVDKTTALGQDVVAQFPIGYVAAASDRLTHVYSLNVKQYAITPDAFAFWQNLKKNTEDLGSIFDPFPSTITGNIHPVGNTSQPAIGFITVSTVTSKRIFLAGRSLPYHFPYPPLPPPDPSDCHPGMVPVDPASTLNQRLDHTFFSGDTIPTVVVESVLTHQVVGYSYATKICVDCRVVGGTNIKPPYWPDNL